MYHLNYQRAVLSLTLFVKIIKIMNRLHVIFIGRGQLQTLSNVLKICELKMSKL